MVYLSQYQKTPLVRRGYANHQVQPRMDETWKDSNTLHTLHSIPQLLLNTCTRMRTETLCHSTLLISIIVLQLQFVRCDILWGARKKSNPLLHLVSCSPCRRSLWMPILAIALVRNTARLPCGYLYSIWFSICCFINFHQEFIIYIGRESCQKALRYNVMQYPA